jgi:hypothetical protein
LHFAILPVLLSLMGIVAGYADDPDEIAAIKQTALDYMQAWYRGDAQRMKACLHKKLAKRSLVGVFGEPGLRHTTAADMTRYTNNGYGTHLYRKGQKIDVVVLDHYKNIASVRVTSPHYYEYLHLAKIDGKWVILNALY